MLNYIVKKQQMLENYMCSIIVFAPTIMSIVMCLRTPMNNTTILESILKYILLFFAFLLGFCFIITIPTMLVYVCINSKLKKQYIAAFVYFMNTVPEALEIKNKYLYAINKYQSKLQDFKSKWGWMDGIIYYDSRNSKNVYTWHYYTIILGLIEEHNKKNNTQYLYHDWALSVLELKYLHDELKRINVEAVSLYLKQSQYYDLLYKESCKQQVVNTFLGGYDNIPTVINNFSVVYSDCTDGYSYQYQVTTGNYDSFINKSLIKKKKLKLKFLNLINQ